MENQIPEPSENRHSRRNIKFSNNIPCNITPEVLVLINELMNKTSLMKKRPFILRLLYGIVAIIIFHYADDIINFITHFNTPPYTVEISVELDKFATSRNRNTPLKIDGNTTLEHITAGDRLLTYDYTVTDLKRFRKAGQAPLEQRAIADLCHDTKTPLFLSHNVNIIHRYKHQEGAELATIQANPSQCEQ